MIARSNAALSAGERGWAGRVARRLGEPARGTALSVARRLGAPARVTALSAVARDGAGATARRLGASARGSIGAGGTGATQGAGEGGVPGPEEAQADRASPATNRHESSALPRQIAGNMALLIEDVPAVSRVPGPRSSVRKLFATRNLTLAVRYGGSTGPEVEERSREADGPRVGAATGMTGVRYKGNTLP